MTSVFSTILFFCLLQIKNKYKNKNSTKNTLLWTLLFGILNSIIIFFSSFKLGYEEGLALSTDIGAPAYDEKSKTFSKSITIKGVKGYMSYQLDDVNKIININIDDAIINSMMPQGIVGPAGAPGIQGNIGVQGVPGPSAKVEITNKAPAIDVNSS